MKKITIICENCGNKKEVYKSWLKQGNRGRFCSKKCYFQIGPKLTRKQAYEVGVRLAKARWGNHIEVKKFGQKPKKKIVRRILLTDLERLEHKRFLNQRYKARKRNAQGSHTLEEWLILKSFYKNMCLCCKKFEPEIKLSEDHIVPLSMGGSDYISNIQPLCVSCNTRKHAKTISYLTLGINGNYLVPPNVVKKEREKLC